VNLNISVAYKEDLERVMQVLNDIGQEMAKDTYFGPLIIDPPKALRVDSFGESGIDIKVLGETLPIRQWEVAGEYRLRVKKAFDRLGIEIPFPHRTIYWGAGGGNPLKYDPTRDGAPSMALEDEKALLGREQTSKQALDFERRDRA
jgi:small-conductance mechanosensitive channel